MFPKLRLNDDHGAITLETVIAVPVLLTAVLGTVNAALWYHARNIALASAQEGVRIARAYGSHNNGAATAISFAHSTGDGFLLSPTAETSGSNATTVVIRVTGQSVSLIPFVHTKVSQVARGPREKFTTPSGAFNPATAPDAGTSGGRS
jgi:Flp pilus assembly protein TadG